MGAVRVSGEWGDVPVPMESAQRGLISCMNSFLLPSVYLRRRAGWLQPRL